MNRLLTASAIVLAIGAASPAWAKMMSFTATMTAASEVPPKDSKGMGKATAMLNTKTKMLKYTVKFSGLTGPATAAHFHGPADAGANAGVEVPLGGDAPKSPIKGSVTLTDAQITDLEAGKFYVNVHTAINPGGEIRGQVMPK